MRPSGAALPTLLASLALTGATAASADAAFLGFDRAKRAIATRAYLTNGAHAVSYGARACRRLSRSRINCEAYVEKSRAGKRRLCVDRMTAVRSRKRVRVVGVAQPRKWRCRARQDGAGSK